VFGIIKGNPFQKFKGDIATNKRKYIAILSLEQVALLRIETGQYFRFSLTCQLYRQRESKYCFFPLIIKTSSIPLDKRYIPQPVIIINIIYFIIAIQLIQSINQSIKQWRYITN